MRYKGPLALLLLLTTLALTRPSQAFVHVVQKGETLAAVAERYYGRVQYERLLVAANHLDAQGGSPIVPGMRLEVPAVSHFTVSKGQTWDQLATLLLGAASRSDVLAIANGTSPWTLPEHDAEIVVPYNLMLILTGNENIVSLAFDYLGDKNKAWVLDNYNGFKGRALRRGDVVLIPLSDLPLTDAGKAAAKRAAGATCNEGRGETRSSQRRVFAEIPALIADVKSGRYVDAVTRGTRFLSVASMTTPQLAVIHRQLLEAYVALEAQGLAATSCAEWRKNDPQARLDPRLLSPKILAACERAP